MVKGKETRKNNIMDKQALIERLEKTVVERTPFYGDIDGRFVYDETLMKANYLLAKISSQNRLATRARIYLRGAEHQLFCFNETLRQKVEPVNMKEKKESKRPPYDLERTLEITRKRKADGKKFHYWTKKVFNLKDRF